MSYAYPTDLATQLGALWGAARPPPRWGTLDELPPEQDLREVLEAAFHASLATDEQRPTRLNVAIVEPGDTRAAFRFGVERELNVAELTKLAPATNAEMAVVGVHRAQGKLAIWGIFYDRLPYGPPLNSAFAVRVSCPVISVRGAGHLLVYGYGLPVAELVRGTLRPARAGALSYRVLSELFDRAVHEALVGLDGRLLGNAYNPQLRYLERMASLVDGIRAEGHGGALFVLPDNFEATMPEVAASLRIKYACADDSAWPAVFEDSQACIKALTGKRTTPEQKGTSDAALVHFGKFANVDGGVVMTDHFRLVGFGAEVLSDLEVAEVVGGVTSERIPTEQYGTRHRSAFRLCAQHPGVVAFICSSDGGIRVATKKNDDVVMWE